MSFDFPTLETERLILRVPKFDHFTAWEPFYASERAQFIGGPVPDQGLSWRTFCHVAGLWMLRGSGSFVFARKETPSHALGMTGPWHPINWPEPELGWTVWDEGVEGTGLAYEAACEARRFAYDALGWSAPVSYIDRDNARSIALAERMGCTIDPDAATPSADKNDVVYRHPKVLP